VSWCNIHYYQSIHWSSLCLVGQLIDWLVDWSVCRSVGRLVDWFEYSLVRSETARTARPRKWDWNIQFSKHSWWTHHQSLLEMRKINVDVGTIPDAFADENSMKSFLRSCRWWRSESSRIFEWETCDEWIQLPAAMLFFVQLSRSTYIESGLMAFGFQRLTLNLEWWITQHERLLTQFNLLETTGSLGARTHSPGPQPLPVPSWLCRGVTSAGKLLDCKESGYSVDIIFHNMVRTSFCCLYNSGISSWKHTLQWPLSVTESIDWLTDR
jgi:hypothetical protein